MLCPETTNEQIHPRRAPTISPGSKRAVFAATPHAARAAGPDAVAATAATRQTVALQPPRRSAPWPRRPLASWIVSGMPQDGIHFQLHTFCGWLIPAVAEQTNQCRMLYKS